MSLCWRVHVSVEAAALLEVYSIFAYFRNTISPVGSPSQLR